VTKQVIGNQYTKSGFTVFSNGIEVRAPQKKKKKRKKKNKEIKKTEPEKTQQKPS
jgi:hypothetical protein